MDRLPCELLHHISSYIDQPLDLIRMSYVCSRWRSFIMNDEYFLNQWFSRSLKRSREFPVDWRASYRGDCQHYSGFNINKSLLPINLRSSTCQILPWTVSRCSYNYELLFEYSYDLSFYDAPHSFSYWLFLPPQYDLNIQIGNCHVDGRNILLCSDQKYHFDNGKSVSIADRWIHIVLTKIHSYANYQMWIDGQYLTKFNHYYLYWDKSIKKFSLFNILLFRKFGNTSLEASSQARIADFNVFKRCLTLVEIRAIHQQQISIKQVKVGTYINSNKDKT